ncbi:MAG: hypothetical protein ACJAT9_000236 [Polaribacter sp.]|jgi:hypothetical protein|tara:strand:- start:28 stop:285 length:258 start_codon:yes stop_codon:yes gene_type:complete
MIKANNKILFQKLGKEAVILHLDSEEYFGLDEIGTRIWEVLKQEGSTEKALSILLEEYNVEEEILRADIEELIEQLRKEKILKDA